MDDTPATEDRDPLNLRVLRILVTVLTVTMIVGLITVVAVFVTRFENGSPVALPDQVTLPEGESARAVTFGPDWYAVVTANDLILIYDRASGDLRQTVTID
ncbi:DUF6476 family protein [Alterinioella nitratireducens]|uniref:DUF6476 family protein n=1 Tax=Alterinioella nitratireducens TaxID=2735915 RepID=UPI004058903A